MQNLLKDAINRNKPEAKSRNLTQLSVATGCFSLWLLPYEKQGTNTQITTKSYRKNTYYIITRTVVKEDRMGNEWPSSKA